MKHPETASLARSAFEASGSKSVSSFVSSFNGAIGLRTFWAWMRGEQPAAALAQLVLREYIAGWRPSQFAERKED